jgi:sugar lactone lactonase YvrE
MSVYASGLNAALGITFDTFNNLYIANSGDNNIIKVDTSGIKTVFDTSYNYPENLVFDTSGYLYVMDSTDTIYKLDTSGNKTTFITNLNAHYLGLAIDAFNNLYYTNTDNKIYKIDTSGITTVFIDDQVSLNYPVGLSFDSPGNLYVSNYNTNFVCKYDSSGILTDASFVSLPVDAYAFNVSVDKADNIYISYITPTSEYINKYNNAGVYISNIATYTPASFSYGMSFDSSNILYYTGQDTNSILRNYFPPVICFLGGSTILTEHGYVAIENLKQGDLVKTLTHGLVPVYGIGSMKIFNEAIDTRIKDQLYLLSNSIYTELTENLVLTGCHSLLVDNLPHDKIEATKELLGCILVTENKHRLPACLDERAVVYPERGEFTVYHICLANENAERNYGIYANGGLLVESCCRLHFNERF